MIDLLRVASLVVPGLMPPGVDWLGLATRALALRRRRRPRASSPGAPVRPRIHPRRHLVRLRRARARAALPGPQDVVGAGWDLRPQVAGRGRLGRLVRPLAARRPVAAGGHPVSPPGDDAALAAAPAVAGRRLVRQRRGRHVRAPGLRCVRQRAPSGDVDSGGMATWVFGLVYGSWLLWAIAAGAATRSYQLRSAVLPMSSPT